MLNNEWIYQQTLNIYVSIYKRIVMHIPRHIQTNENDSIAYHGYTAADNVIDLVQPNM